MKGYRLKDMQINFIIITVILLVSILLFDLWDEKQQEKN